MAEPVKNLSQKIKVAIPGLFICALSLLVLVLLISAVDAVLLTPPQQEGPGTSQVIKFSLGGFLTLLLPVAWLGLVLFTFAHLAKGLEKGELLQHFALLAAINIYLFPLVVLLYQVLFPIPMIGRMLALPVTSVKMDWSLAAGGLVLGTVLLCLHRCFLQKNV